MNIFSLVGSIMVDSSAADASLQKTDKNVESVGGKFLKGIGTVAKWGAAAALAAGTAAVAVVGLAVNVGEDLKKALNGLQSQTGSTDEAMIGMKDSMLAIYNNNFGEDFEDIAVSMATVAKATGLTGKELESATTNALLMRDTFEMEVSGSIIAVNQLMDQFGLSSEEAYNLMAQGAQKGMNAQDDLVDIVKEYSVQFKTMGFSAEEMFNMLSNGAKEGGFSIDVMGDAMKEFNIRSKDGSDSSAEAFKSLGLNADNLTKSFSKGGAEGKKAFTDVVSKLKEMKDPTEQNTAGVALFGTMWEDLGAKAILAMGNTQGEINKTTDALAKINQVKYDTFGEAMVGIKRNIETGILLPISDRVLPVLSKFSNWIIANMPVIKTYISDMTTLALDKFDKIVAIVKDIAENIFPNMKTSSFDLKEEVKSLVTTGFDIMITALTWIRDNIPLITVVVGGLTTVWAIQKGIVIAHNLALMAHNIQLAIAWAKDAALTVAIIALYVAQGIGTAITWLGVAAQTAFNVVMGIGLLPILGIIAGLALLGLGIYAVIKHWKDICAWVQKTWDKFTNNPIGKFIIATNPLLAALKLIVDHWTDITDAIKKAWDWLTSWNNKEVKDKTSTVTTNYASTGNKPSKYTAPSGYYSGNGAPAAGFAVGSRYVPYDMRTTVHEGEMITPKSENPYANSKGKITPDGGQSNKQPIAIQLVLQNGKAIAEFLVDDLDNLMGGKNKVTARSVGI